MHVLVHLPLALLVVASAAHGQFKCTGADGAVTFQQAPCSDTQRAERIRIDMAPTPADARPQHIRQALAERKIAIGMTRAELDRVMIQRPTKINASVYATGRQDQIIYEQPGRTLYVYTEDDIVTAVQDRQRSAPPAPAPRPAGKPCPSTREIKELEFQASLLENRNNGPKQAEIARQLGEARRCGQ